MHCKNENKLLEITLAPLREALLDVLLLQVEILVLQGFGCKRCNN